MRVPPLTMHCTIARCGTQSDSYGEPVAPQTVGTNVPCYWWAGQAYASAPGDLQSMVAVTLEHIIFAPGQDVRTGDLVMSVSDHLGREVFAADAYRIVIGAAVMRNHIDCTLRIGEAIGGRS